MDLSQTKLTRSEWNSIEIPTEKSELDIIQLIAKGYNNPDICENNTISLLKYLKITETDTIHDYVYCTYLQEHFKILSKKYHIKYQEITYKKNKMKKADIIRFSNTDKHLDVNKDKIFEFIILKWLENLFKEKKKNEKSWYKWYYTIYTLMTYKIEQVNKVFKQKITDILESTKSAIVLQEMFEMSDVLIEKNVDILKYSDKMLYEHQKELFAVCKKPGSKLISYIAPTGTGKTLSPLGLSEGSRIIFVCAARHVGLALAKASISSEKKVAFAFGCNTQEDIRLHYFAATDYVRNKRSGKIAKVDNSIGDKVEIMICDIKSYLLAMNYMIKFNRPENIILYWDEPTITLDYQEHPIHKTIKDNWCKNVIPNVILSSATLPTQEEMSVSINDFCNMFSDATVYNIGSYDFKKTIPIINKEGFVEMPHYICRNYDDLKTIVEHCQENNTILRYIDLSEIITFALLLDKKNYLHNENLRISRYFDAIEKVNMASIKKYYLVLLQNIDRDMWSTLYNEIQKQRVPRYKSTIYISTADAHTLTNGPTIFLANNIDNISNFCIKTANIPSRVEKDILKVIEFNTDVNNKIDMMQRNVEDSIKKDDEKEKKINDGRVAPAIKQLMDKISDLQRTVKSVELAPIFVPNTPQHIDRYSSMAKNYDKKNDSLPFTCDITDDIVEKIMLINDIDVKWKLLLLMGIGVFTTHNSREYTEIMKELAYQQKLYIIIASTDFIYGTNYQFCHSYISKDLEKMSQEKLIQAMGRVGRRNIQSDYTIRFRENNLIHKLFFPEKNKPEVENMRKLMASTL